MIKTVDGSVYYADVVEKYEEAIKVKNLRYQNVPTTAQIPNLNSLDPSETYKGDVIFFWDQIILYSEQ